MSSADFVPLVALVSSPLLALLQAARDHAEEINWKDAFEHLRNLIPALLGAQVRAVSPREAMTEAARLALLGLVADLISEDADRRIEALEALTPTCDSTVTTAELAFALLLGLGRALKDPSRSIRRAAEEAAGRLSEVLSVLPSRFTEEELEDTAARLGDDFGPELEEWALNISREEASARRAGRHKVFMEIRKASKAERSGGAA